MSTKNNLAVQSPVIVAWRETELWLSVGSAAHKTEVTEKQRRKRRLSYTERVIDSASSNEHPNPEVDDMQKTQNRWPCVSTIRLCTVVALPNAISKWTG